MFSSTSISVHVPSEALRASHAGSESLRGREGPLYGLTIRLSETASLSHFVPPEVAFLTIALKLKPLGFVPLPAHPYLSGPFAKQVSDRFTRSFLCVRSHISNLLIMHETIEALQELEWLETYSADLEAFSVDLDRTG